MSRVLTAGRPAAGVGSDEKGFTLVELLVSVAVLGLVVFALSAVMFGSLSANVATKERLDETRDEQFAAAYFGTDVQAASTVVKSSPARCGTGTSVVEFRGTSYDPVTYAARVTVVSYVHATATVDGKPAGQLRRQSCEAAADPPPVYPLATTSSTVVAHRLTIGAPTVSCVPSPCGDATRSVILRASGRTGDAPFELLGTRRTSP